MVGRERAGYKDGELGRGRGGGRLGRVKEGVKEEGQGWNERRSEKERMLAREKAYWGRDGWLAL